MKKFKEGQQVYCLYVNHATPYISFKIEVGKYLGTVKDYKLGDFKAVEHTDDEVNYLNLEDIFESEKQAAIYLSELLKQKYEGNKRIKTKTSPKGK
jgi:hypothetical protein